MPRYQTPEGRNRAEPDRTPILEGRLAAGLTQEAMAELLNVDTRTLRRYESGEVPTPDELMLAAAGEAKQPFLLYKHFKSKYRIGDDMMPPVEPVPLALAVVGLLSELEKLERNRVASRLLELARDGIIDPAETADFQVIMDKLDGVRRAVELLRYSRR